MLSEDTEGKPYVFMRNGCSIASTLLVRVSFTAGIEELLQGVEYTTMEEAFNSPNIVKLLMNIDRLLKI